MSKREATTKRISEAARDEFADYGFAGARIDRIAQLAACNKQAIYAYIGDKKALWKAVYTTLVEETINAVPLDARNLPEYAGRLFDRYRAHPQTLRLSFWYSLEGPASEDTADMLRHAAGLKIAAIAKAQAEGHVTKDFQSDMLLSLVLRLSMASENPPEGVLPTTRNKDTRSSIVRAVERLVKP